MTKIKVSLRERYVPISKKNISMSDGNNAKEAYICDYCGEAFDSKTELVVHIKIQHRNAQTTKTITNNKINLFTLINYKECDKCDYITDNNYNFAQHMRQHSTKSNWSGFRKSNTRTYECDICHKKKKKTTS